MFSIKQIFEVINIINKWNILFIAKNVGTDILQEQDKKTLKLAGFNEVDFSAMGKIEEQYRFGMLSSAIKEAQLKKLTYFQFKKFLSEQKFLPLTALEQETLQAIKFQAYGDIKGLGDKLSRDMTRMIIDKQKRARSEKIIRIEAEKAIRERKSVKEFSSALAKATKNYLKDWDRVADYLMHSAYDEGRAMQLLRTQGKNVFCYKDVKSEACESCQKLYLTQGFNSKPIIFRLEQLFENGSNIGRKKEELKAVIGPTHPWCRCTLQTIPIGMMWNEKTKSFDKPIEIIRRTKSKIKISVNGKEID